MNIYNELKYDILLAYDIHIKKPAQYIKGEIKNQNQLVESYNS